MKRGLKFMCAVGAMGVGFAFTPRAEAITLSEAFAKAFQDPISPIIMEDDDFQVIVDVDASGGATIGDQIFGVFLATSIAPSGLNTPPETIKDANDTISGVPAEKTLLGDGSSGNNALNAIFAVQILSLLPNLEGGVDVIVGPIAGAWAFPNTTGYTPHAAGAVIEVYEDGPGLAGTAADAGTSFQAAVDTFTDGNFLASIGFSALPNVLGGANLNDEYFFNRDRGDAGFVPETFEMNLNFLLVNNTVSNPFSVILPNDVAGPTVGTTYGVTHQFGQGAGFYGDGQLFAGFGLTNGVDAWNFTSDGNFAVLVPTPAAVWPGLALLGMLAVRRNRRTRAVA